MLPPRRDDRGCGVSQLVVRDPKMAAVRSDGHSLVERWVGASEALGRGAAENRRDGGQSVWI